jgi:hypothetical protein
MAATKVKGHCKHAASHRKAQAKYVSGHKDKHRAMVKRHYNANATAILAKKKKARKGKDHKSGGKIGRPRECG